MPAPTGGVKGSDLTTATTFEAADFLLGIDTSADESKKFPPDVVGSALNARGVYSSLPSASFAGRTYHATDAGLVLRDNGSSWDVVSYTGGKITLPPTSGWTTLSSSTTHTQSGGMRIMAANDSNTTDALQIEYRTVPTAPYVITAKIEYDLKFINAFSFGLCWLDNSSQLVTYGYTRYVDSSNVRNDTIELLKWNSRTSYNGFYQSLRTFSPLWFRIADNNTNRTVSVSPNGLDWTSESYFDQSRTNFLTATRVGWFMHLEDTELPSVSVPAIARLVSWEET